MEISESVRWVKDVCLGSLQIKLRNKDPQTALHAANTSKLAAVVAGRLGIKDTLELRLGCLLHDVGKLLLSIEPAKRKLTYTDYEVVQKHPILGYMILKEAGYPNEVAEVALYHHERIDGRGYPFGISRNEIPLFARICAVVDAFDVMVSGRPYQPRIPVAAALNELHRHSGLQFDPIVVTALAQAAPQILGTIVSPRNLAIRVSSHA
ncbi:HD-GYP domain-containing protein [Acetonema longum]|uniref:Metal dependent phosphohydrolase n=1 Tax=Acetonema longum DSM 6540 TaxID=1009370 RepID=F7NF39_9FIRM|nr:HD domain-containing phosphohydrolase [Acetonema longum]EGO65294.1 metal dependent phosphohydrolase [Acetonema longum DSM 6540]